MIFKLCREKRAKCLQVYLGSLGCLKIKELLLPQEQRSESYHIYLIITDICVAVLLFFAVQKHLYGFPLNVAMILVFSETLSLG